MLVLKTPFPFTELEVYCRLHGIEDFDEREEFVECMVRMSAALQDEQAEMAEEKRQAEKDSAKESPQHDVRTQLG